MPLREGRHSEAFYALLERIPKQSRSRSIVEAVIVAASGELARTRDERALTLKQVSKRAGIGMGSLYDYFVDREAVLAGVAAKFTDDNLDEFERLVAQTKTLPLREAVELLVDAGFERFAGDREYVRALVKLALQVGIGMMGALAESGRAFTSTLGRAFAERSDVREMGHAAWTSVSSPLRRSAS